MCSLQGTILDGHALILQLCQVKKDEQVLNKADNDRSSTKLLVRNVAFEATEKDLRKLFSPFGKVISFLLMSCVHCMDCFRCVHHGLVEGDTQCSNTLIVLDVIFVSSCQQANSMFILFNKIKVFVGSSKFWTIAPVRVNESVACFIHTNCLRVHFF